MAKREAKGSACCLMSHFGKQRSDVGFVLQEAASKAGRDTHVSSKNLLSIEFENQTQHTVGGGVLGTKVDGEMTERAVLPAAAFAEDLLCTLVVKLFDSVSRDRWRRGHGLGLRVGILSLSGERAASGGGKESAGCRWCARSVELSCRSNGAEERRCHDEERKSGGGCLRRRCDGRLWCAILRGDDDGKPAVMLGQ
jgi:hypothetical protein